MYNQHRHIQSQGRSRWPTCTRTATIAASGFFGCNIVTNVYSTSAVPMACVDNCRSDPSAGAITYRILRVAKDCGHGQRRLRNTARILADSGFLYTSVTIFYVISLLLGNETSGRYAFQYMLGDIVCLSILSIRV